MNEQDERHPHKGHHGVGKESQIIMPGGVPQQSGHPVGHNGPNS